MTTILTLDDDLSPLVAALLAGRPTVIPTDTVYGLACAAHLPAACDRMLALKGRGADRPASLLCPSVETLFTTALPELFGRAGVRARRLLPGPVTLVVPNPSGRFRWICGGRPDRVGVRVPELPAQLAAALERVGTLVATSANPTGGADPTRLEDVDPNLLDRVAVAVDAGPTPGGRPSTVVDITGPEPAILREGGLDADEIRRRLA